MKEFPVCLEIDLIVRFSLFFTCIRLWICVEQEERRKMNRWAYQQKAMVGGCVADGVVCPKPRRVGVPLHFHEPIRPPSRLLHIKYVTLSLSQFSVF